MINAVMVREMRSRMRGWRTAAIITGYLAVLAGITAAILIADAGSQSTLSQSAQAGANMFAVLSLFSCCCLGSHFCWMSKSRTSSCKREGNLPRFNRLEWEPDETPRNFVRNSISAAVYQWMKKTIAKLTSRKKPGRPLEKDQYENGEFVFTA